MCWQGAVAVSFSPAALGGSPSPLDDSISFSNTAVELPAYGVATVPFTFKPMTEGWAEIGVQLSFDHPSCASQQVVVKARAVPPPVYVDVVSCDVCAPLTAWTPVRVLPQLMCLSCACSVGH